MGRPPPAATRAPLPGASPLTLDCAELHERVDLLHELAADRMLAAKKAGSHQHGYIIRPCEVVALEEVAAEAEAKIG